LVAESHVTTINDRVGAIGNDQLKRIEFVAVKSVVTNRNPIDINRSWSNFVQYLPVAVSGIEIASKRRYNSVSVRRIGSG